MSESATEQAHRIAGNESNWLGCGHSHPRGERALAVEIAAAEERGRRCGVEEAAKECELRIASWERLRDQPTVAARIDEAESLAEIIRYLAPRDSGKVET